MFKNVRFLLLNSYRNLHRLLPFFPFSFSRILFDVSVLVSCGYQLESRAVEGYSP
jgi:hypothetical protein